MLTRIGSFINPSLAKGDTVDKPDTEKRREREQGQKREEEDAPQEDATFFSIEAIRALLEQEKVEIDEETRGSFERLKKHGVGSIPIRNEQPILEAIAEAARPLAP